MEYYNDIQSSTTNHAGTVCKTELQTKETLTTIKAAGYDGIELNGFMIRPTPFLVRMLTKFSGCRLVKAAIITGKSSSGKAS